MSDIIESKFMSLSARGHMEYFDAQLDCWELFDPASFIPLESAL